MRSDGFDRMDVSTSLPDDQKFRALARRYPDKLAPAGWAYVSLLALSWREAGRLSLDEGWPFGLPWDQEAADALLAVGLVDEEYRLPEKPWEAWFGTASERRRLGRERQHRADAKRGRTGKQSDSQGRQSGSTDSPSVSQSGPTPDQRRSSVGLTDDPVDPKRTDGPAIVPDEGPCRICGGHVRSTDDGSRVGRGWIEHVEHPDDYAVSVA